MKLRKGNILLLIILGISIIAVGSASYFWWKSSGKYCGGPFGVGCSKGETCQPNDPKNPGAGGSCSPSNQSSPNPEEIVCGTIAGNLPEHKCPNGYHCQLHDTYPDAAGSCVKN